MHDKAKKAQPTGRTFKVIQTLKRQINLLRSVQSNEDWKLTYFREAIKMEDFNVVVQTVQRIPGCGIFSTLQEIEVLEEGIRNNDTVELTVQCCVILYVFERTVEERLPDPSIDRRWPFVSCQSLEEIAYLRHRLRFVEDSSYLLEELNISLMLAVHRYVGKQISLLNWRGLLLVFREANPGCIYRLLMFLILVLQDENDKMPAEAASLFLSYVASAIYVLSGSLGGYECPLEEKMVMKLLQLGASPMVSEEHHHVLFARLENHLQTRRWPGWMPIDASKSGPKKRYPTALNQLLAHTWCDEVVEVLAERTCCSLDAVGSFKKNFNVERLLSLRCLASQKLRETDLEQLSGTMKFLASKHRPIKLQDFSDLR